MNHLASESRSLALPSSLFAGFAFAAALFNPVAAQAQLILAETYSVPAYVDGAAHSVAFDFSSQLSWTSAPITHTTLTIDFSKLPDLFDDPPFLSEVGLVLRKLDYSFSILEEVTLIELGSFFDGAPSWQFSGTITFDDDATDYIHANPDVLSAGVFKPVESLAALNGVYSPFWELRVVDAALQNPLLFRSASLSIALPVPEPSVVGAAGSILLIGLSLLRRRRAVTST